MSVTTCLHPNCDVPTARNRSCCPRHWYQLPDEMRAEILSAARSDASLLEYALNEATEYLADRLIGEHETAFCVDGCGADIVWMPTQRGKKVPVEAESVSADDVVFKRGQHDVHFDNCPKHTPRR